MDWNLEKVSQFFQVLELCYEKIAKKDIIWVALPAKFHFILR